VLHALAQVGVAKVSVCNRGQERLHTFIGHARKTYSKLVVEEVPWNQQDVGDACKRAVLMVNTTNIGLRGQVEHFPFQLPGNGVALDAVYAQDGNTAFGCAAEQSGHRAVDGLPMLLAQGVASFYYWHQIEPARASALHWMEAKLGRISTDLPGWGNVV